MLVPKGRDVLIEQKPALKLWLTIKLKRHRPMFVECTLALSGGRFWMIEVCGIWVLWLEQGLTLVEGNGCPCWWYRVEVYDDDWLYVSSKLLCSFLEWGLERVVCLIAGAIICFWGGMCEGGWLYSQLQAVWLPSPSLTSMLYTRVQTCNLTCN